MCGIESLRRNRKTQKVCRLREGGERQPALRGPVGILRTSDCVASTPGTNASSPAHATSEPATNAYSSTCTPTVSRIRPRYPAHVLSSPFLCSLTHMLEHMSHWTSLLLRQLAAKRALFAASLRTSRRKNWLKEGRNVLCMHFKGRCAYFSLR